MAFTVTGPDTFLASGHPDLRETDMPVHVGLIESTDSANSRQSLSLEGKADFHALEPAANRVYGYDSQPGAVEVTRDRQEWEDIAQLPVIEWPSRDLLVGVSADGAIHQSRDSGQSWQSLMPVGATPEATVSSVNIAAWR